MSQERLIPQEALNKRGLSYAVCEWTCANCGTGLFDPMYKQVRGLEARLWTVIHYSDWTAGGKWRTLRYCPKCAAQAIKALPNNLKEEAG